MKKICFCGLFAGLLVLPSFLLAQEPVLALRSAASQNIRGAHVTESGHVYAITFVNGALRVCYQTGSPAPNAVYGEGAGSTGNFDPELPLSTIHGTDLVIVSALGTGAGKTATVIDGLGRAYYRLTPANYPSSLNSPQLAGVWGIGLPLENSTRTVAKSSAAKFYAGFHFIETDAPGSAMGLVFRPTTPFAGPYPQPSVFRPSRPDTPDNLSRRGNRLETLIPLPKLGNRAVVYHTTPWGFANDMMPSPNSFYSRPAEWHFDDEGELLGTYGQPVRIMPIPTTCSGPGLPPDTQCTEVYEVAPWVDSTFLVAGGTSAGPNGALIVDSPPATAPTKKKRRPKIDCEKADLNGDGKVDGADMDLLMEYSLAQPQDLRGDLTGNGRIDSSDFKYMHRAIEECNKGSKIATFHGHMNAILTTGQPLPGLPNHAMDFITGVRANGLGTGVIMVSATNTDTSQQVDAVILADGTGIRTIMKTGDNFGQGAITGIGDPTVRRGLSQVNRHGQFAVTAALADGTYAVYRIDGTNAEELELSATPAEVILALGDHEEPSISHDVNMDGVVDAADVVAALD